MLGSALALPIKDRSVDCIVSSPPYGAGIDYSHYDDIAPWTTKYKALVKCSVLEMYRVTKPGARVWINVMPSVPGFDDDGMRFPLGALWGRELCLLFNYRDTVVWRQDSYDGGCAWGSWRRPSAPNLRGGYEIVMSCYKPPWKRVPPVGYEKYQDEGEDWQDLCRNVWTISPAKRTVDAPAPFPEELVERCIRLSTWPGENVLDPFAGSGTTTRVANSMGRIGVGVDLV